MRKLIASRWLPRHLRIAVCPDKVVVVCVERAWRDRVVEKRIVEVVRDTANPLWKAPLAALGEVLADYTKANISACVVVSNHFVRYAIVPWRDTVATNDEQRALARHCLKNIYGDIAAKWDIRISGDGFRRNALASAIDMELIAELDQVFATSKIPLSSVQPYFMTACNRFHKELKSRKAGCLAVVEQGRTALGFYDRLGWQALIVRRLAETNSAALAPLLAQELQSVNLVDIPEHLFVAAAEHPRLDFTNGSWTTRMLQLKAQLGFSPLDDARYAIALCGAA